MSSKYTYAILKNPEYTRVSFLDSDRLAINELTLTLPVDNIRISLIGGVSYVLFDQSNPIADEEIRLISRLSFAYAIFQVQGELLAPITLNPEYFLNRELSSILKYSGKTNELFTRLMLNLAGLHLKNVTQPLSILDPMAGKGTTLYEALMQGHNAYGIEIEPKPPQEGQIYLKKYLETNKVKHSTHTEKISGTSDFGKFTSTRYQLQISKTLDFEIISGDSRNASHFYKKNQFNAIIADLPYGVQHGSKTAKRSPGFTRNASGLLVEALPGWVKLLKPGGVMVLAWNLFLIPRAKMAEMLMDNGLKVSESISEMDFSHKVDQAIDRDLIIGVR